MDTASQPLGWIMLAASLVCLLSLSGALLLALPHHLLERWMPRLVSLAIGVLLGDAFLHLLPHAIAHSERLVHDHGVRVFAAALAGMLLFHLLEHAMHWHAEHRVPAPEAGPALRAGTGPTLLAADAVHGLVDGALIAASFLYSTETGLLTTLAIVAHECVQEPTKFAILMQTGWSRTRVILLNLVCGTTVFAGAALTLLALKWTVINLGLLLAVTAGGFIYIAVGDLIPSIREQIASGRSRRAQLAFTASGLALMHALTWLEVH